APSLRRMQRDGVEQTAAAGPAVPLVPEAAADADPVAAALAAARARLPEQVRVRHAKYERMLAEGIEPYPVGHPRTASLAQVRERFGHLGPDTATAEQVSVAGGVVRVRDFRSEECRVGKEC